MTVRDDELEKLRSENARLAEDIAALQGRLRASNKARAASDEETSGALNDVAKLRVETDRLSKELRKRIATAAIDAALNEAGACAPLLRAHLIDRVDVDIADFSVVVRDKQGRRDWNLAGQASSVQDLVAEYKRDPAFQMAFDRPAAQSEPTAANIPSDGLNLTERMLAVKAARAQAAKEPLSKADIEAAWAANPYGIETFNLTRAHRIAVADPELAQRLKAAAGHAARAL